MGQRRGGYLLKITQGVHINHFGVAYHREQQPSFKPQKKLLVHFYEDQLLQRPVMQENKASVGLIQASFCQALGMVD